MDELMYRVIAHTSSKTLFTVFTDIVLSEDSDVAKDFARQIGLVSVDHKCRFMLAAINGLNRRKSVSKFTVGKSRVSLAEGVVQELSALMHSYLDNECEYFVKFWEFCEHAESVAHSPEIFVHNVYDDFVDFIYEHYLTIYTT